MQGKARCLAPGRRRHSCGGGVLVIAMILLVVIGLTAAASMRRTVSSERASNNLRLEGLAQQFAELALRYCESELQQAPGQRSDAYLKSLDTADAVPEADANAWRSFASWKVLPATAASSVAVHAVEVPDTWVSTLAVADRAFTLNKRPQCLVEKVGLGANGQDKTILRVTARGFSPDYTEDDATGAATNGSIVWLRSELVLQ